MAFKTNVVKTWWRVKTKEIKGFRRKDLIVQAESEEAAKLKAPDGFEVLSVERMDGSDGGCA